VRELAAAEAQPQPPRQLVAQHNTPRMQLALGDVVEHLARALRG
jgi:hypothetical protein